MLRGNYITRIDDKGRIKLPTTFRRYLNYLEVWSLGHFQARLVVEPYTDKDAATLTQLGI